MTIGASTLVLVCSAGSPAALPCPDGTGPAVVESYLLGVSAAEFIEVSAAPFDAAKATEFWGIGLSAVLICWFVAFATKQVIRAVF